MMSLFLQQYWEDTLRTPRYAEPGRLLRFGAKAYSQHDEDGILAEIFRRVSVDTRTFVEIGVGTGVENNTLALLLSGWRGAWIEADAHNVEAARQQLASYIGAGQLGLHQTFVTRENADALLQGVSPSRAPDVLSIDVDGNDYWIWDAVESLTPRVVVIEYNASWFPPLALTVEYDASFRWDGSNYFGASLKALEILGARKGYRLVGCGFAGINAFFVREDLCRGASFCAPFTAENHFEPPRYWMYRSSGHRAGVGRVACIAAQEVGTCETA
jgi:hypothetical protein